MRLRVGPHSFWTFDLMRGAPRAADLMYCDLPYDQRILTYFWTLNEERGPKPDLGTIYENVVDAACMCGVALLETGVRSAPTLHRIALDRAWGGVTVGGPYEATYSKGKHHCRIVTVSQEPIRGGLPLLDSTEAPSWAVRRFTKPGGGVTDPCVGLGLTARETASQGRVFFGSDVNPARLRRAADSVSRKLGLPIEEEI